MTLNQQLVKSVKALVAEEINAVDLESGLCRFCNNVVEGYDPASLQGHRRSCPWVRVRELVQKM